MELKGISKRKYSSLSTFKTDKWEFISNDESNPRCPHGPTLLLKRKCLNETKNYYTCSAYRSIKFCSFYFPANKDLSNVKMKNLEFSRKLLYSHKEYMKRLQVFLTYNNEDQNFCKTCSELLLIEEKYDHLQKMHNVVSINVTVHLPTSLLCPIIDNKALSQFHFSEPTLHYLINQLKALKLYNVICIGCPRIHEKLIFGNKNIFQSLLLDIDSRYMQFYTDEQFCHYNLINHWFFGNLKAEKVFKKFISRNSDRIVIILDPPFGALIDAISNTLNKICELWQTSCNKPTTEPPIIWCFPYFHEERIIRNHKSMQMLDYQVNYQTQKHFNRGGSPVRIFTNLPLSSFALLQNYGYKYCIICCKYISKLNKHCQWCNNCTSKNGAEYVHCEQCSICVKATHKHCKICNKCHLISYKCQNFKRKKQET